MPAKISNENWDKFISMIGEGNYVILAMSSGKDWKHGQFLISPQGMDNMRQYLMS